MYLIGDKVKVVEKKPGNYFYNKIYKSKIGKTGIIKRQKGSYFYLIEFDNGEEDVVFADMLEPFNEEEKNKAHLYMNLKCNHIKSKHIKKLDMEINLGYIGEETSLTALFNEKLYVGDIVESYNPISKVTGKHFVCKDLTKGTYFIMGFKESTENLKDGISEERRFRKIKSYKELENNEEVDEVIAIIGGEK